MRNVFWVVGSNMASSCFAYVGRKVRLPFTLVLRMTEVWFVAVVARTGFVFAQLRRKT